MMERKILENNMSHIKFDYSKVLDKFVAPYEVEYMQSSNSSRWIDP